MGRRFSPPPEGGREGAHADRDRKGRSTMPDGAHVSPTDPPFSPSKAFPWEGLPKGAGSSPILGTRGSGRHLRLLLPWPRGRENSRTSVRMPCASFHRSRRRARSSGQARKLATKTGPGARSTGPVSAKVSVVGRPDRLNHERLCGRAPRVHEVNTQRRPPCRSAAPLACEGRACCLCGSH